MARYRVRSVAPGGLLFPGALAGGLVAALPGAVLAYAAVLGIHGVRATLESWRSVRLPLPAPLPSPSMDMVELLRLTTHLDSLRAWDAALPLVFAALLAVCLTLGALAGALTALLIALLINAGASLGGGITVRLDPLE